MDKVQLHDKTFRPFIPQAEIESSIRSLAGKINADYKDSQVVPLFICVLNGAMMFTSELMKYLDFPLELTALRVSSYNGTKTSGTVKELLGLSTDVKGRDVVLCEDIVDTGITIAAVRKTILEQGAASVKICTMLLKPEVFNGSAPLDYVGKEIPNDFIVGYGLDYDELGRNLKDIYVLDK